jgi:hypothetical protein
MAESAVHADMPYCVLGSTGEQVSALGLGGWHLGFRRVDEHLSIRSARLGSVISHRLHGSVESIEINVGGSCGEVSSPPRKRMGVGAAIVLGARESRVQGGRAAGD